MDINDTYSKKMKILVICGVLIIAAVIALWKISSDAFENHECYVSVTAREMLENGNWILPTCNGQARLQKTPLTYWLVAGVSKITGSVNEFSARLPSAVFAILSAAAILYFVNLWLSFRIAVLSAITWATSYSYIRFSHNARPEMALTFFILLCFLTFYSAINASSRKKQVIYMLIFWVSFGLGNLAKGPAPIPLVAIPLFFYIAIFKQWKLIPKLLPIWGPIIFLAILLPWPLAAIAKVNWNLDVWKCEFVDRLFGEYAEGKYPFYFYFITMFKYAAPWVVFLPLTLLAPFFSIWGKKQNVMKFLWLWFVADLIFLTLDAGKRQHYILSLMPAIAILTGILLDDLIFTQKAHTPKQAKNILLANIGVIIVAAIAIPVSIAIIGMTKKNAGNSVHLPLFKAASMLSFAMTAMVLAAAAMFARKKPVWGVGVIYVGLCICVMILYAKFMPLLDENTFERNFARRIAEIVPKNDTLIADVKVSKVIVQYFGRTIPEAAANDVYQLYEKGCWIVAGDEHLKKMEEGGRFRKIYGQTKRRDVPLGLFHKSAAIIPQ